MRIDAALPRTSTSYIISNGEIGFNLHVFHLHDYLQERNYGVNQEVPVYIYRQLHGQKYVDPCLSNIPFQNHGH